MIININKDYPEVNMDDLLRIQIYYHNMGSS